MTNLNYYLEQKSGGLVAYDAESDFFVMFNQRERKWVPGNVSFQAFEQDFIDTLVEIDEKQTEAMTKGVLPNQRFEEYKNFLSKGQ